MKTLDKLYWQKKQLTCLFLSEQTAKIALGEVPSLRAKRTDLITGDLELVLQWTQINKLIKVTLISY